MAMANHHYKVKIITITIHSDVFTEKTMKNSTSQLKGQCAAYEVVQLLKVHMIHLDPNKFYY